MLNTVADALKRSTRLRKHVGSALCEDNLSGVLALAAHSFAIAPMATFFWRFERSAPRLEPKKIGQVVCQREVQERDIFCLTLVKSTAATRSYVHPMPSSHAQQWHQVQALTAAG
jgi:hypothetical protein